MYTAKAALLLIAAAMFALFACGDTATKTGGASPTAAAGAPANTEAAAAPAKAAAIGDAVSVGGKAQWTVVSATDKGQEVKGDNEYTTPIKTTGKFLEIVASVKAEGSDSFTLSAPKVKDSQGREFDSSSDAIMILGDKNCLLENVNPGIEKQCTWIYELPADATGLTLLAAAGMFDDTVPIDLGQ